MSLVPSLPNNHNLEPEFCVGHIDGTVLMRMKDYRWYNPMQRASLSNIDEILIHGLPRTVTPKIAWSIVSELGHICLLRYKINIFGLFRGYMYVQFLYPMDTARALILLPMIFRRHSLNVYIALKPFQP